MRQLRRDSKILLPKLDVATSLWTRTKGLLGRKDLPADEGLWILRCNSIHTFFMNFPIDVVFLNRKMKVTKVITNLRPGRVVLPVWSASSVIELRQGFLHDHPIAVGETLNVDPALS